MTTPDIVIVITVAGTALVTVINAVGAHWGRQKAQNERAAANVERAIVRVNTDNKLDAIHSLANGNLSEMQGKLSVALERIDGLEALLRSERR